MESKEWSSCIKSNMQKHIRRGNVELAVAAAKEMDRVNPAGLRSRLPLILVEDAWLVAHILPWVKKEPVKAVAVMARSQKNKDCCWIMDEVNRLNPDGGLGKMEEIEAGIASKDYVGATLAAWRCVKAGKLHAVANLLRGSNSASLFGGTSYPVNPICKTLMDRVEEGTYLEGDTQTSLAGSVLVRCGLGPKEIQVDDTVPDTPPFKLKWYGCDFHTPVGRLAVKALIKRGLDEKTLKDAWFWCESVKLGPESHQWWTWRQATQFWSGKDPDVLLDIWTRYKPEVKALVAWAGGKIFEAEIDLED